VLVPAGKKIIVAREFGKDSPTFTMDDQPLPQDVADRLNLVLAVGDANKPDEDETFGTKEPRRVGDTWEGNKELIFNTLKDMKVPVEKEGIATTVKLRDVRSVSGVSCGIIDCSFSVPLAPGTRLPGMPGWMKIQSGKLDMLIQETLPVDVSGKPQAAARHLSMTIVVGGRSPEGAAIVTTMTRVSQAEGTREYPK
jgi:hypothetical protein